MTGGITKRYFIAGGIVRRKIILTDDNRKVTVGNNTGIKKIIISYATGVHGREITSLKEMHEAQIPLQIEKRIIR